MRPCVVGRATDVDVSVVKLAKGCKRDLEEARSRPYHVLVNM